MWIHWCCTRHCYIHFLLYKQLFRYLSNILLSRLCCVCRSFIIHFRNLIFRPAFMLPNKFGQIAPEYFFFCHRSFVRFFVDRARKVFPLNGDNTKKRPKDERWTCLSTIETFMWWHFSNNAVVNCSSCRWSIVCPQNVCIGRCAQSKVIHFSIFCDSSWPIAVAVPYLRSGVVFFSPFMMKWAFFCSAKSKSDFAVVRILILASTPDTNIYLLFVRFHFILVLFLYIALSS